MLPNGNSVSLGRCQGETRRNAGYYGQVQEIRIVQLTSGDTEGHRVISRAFLSCEETLKGCALLCAAILDDVTYSSSGQREDKCTFLPAEVPLR